MSFTIKLGNFLFKNCYLLYKPVYSLFKKKQDAFEIRIIKKYLRKGDVVLDIGSNIGFYAKMLSEIVGPKGKVHCFEPDETNFLHMQQNIQGFTNIEVNNVAVGARTEMLKIYTSPNLNVDHRTYEPETYEEVLEVPAMSIDDYLKDNSRVNMIKIDIQGFEMQALLGMKKTLSKNPNIKIISEFWPYGLKKSGSSLSEYYEALLAEGFMCYLLEKNTLSLLTINRVKDLESLPEEYYFNILASRQHV